MGPLSPHISRQTHRTTWKPSSPWSGKSIENHLAIIWKFWMSIWLFGECSWISLFMQQFISEKTMTRIYITRRTSLGFLGTIILWNKKTDSWTVRIRWSQTPEIVGLKIIYWIRRNYAEIDKLIEQQSSSDPKCPNLHLLRLSALCGKMGDDPDAAWKIKIKWNSENNHFTELNRIDGNHCVGPPREDSKFNDRSTVWTGALQRQDYHVNVQHKKQCDYNSQTVANYARTFPRGHWSFLGRGLEDKWYGTYTDKPMDYGIEWQKKWWQTSLDPVIQYPVPPVHWRGVLRSKRGGKKSIHFNGSNENIELLLRTVISANLCLRSNSGSVQRTIRRFLRSGETWSTWSLGNDGNSYWLFYCRNSLANEQKQGNLVQYCERRFEQVSDDQTLSKPCSDAGWKIVE